MLFVVQIGHAPGADLLAWVTHGAGVRPLQPRPVVDRPRVCPTPDVHHLAAVALGHHHIIDAAHSGKRAHAAGEAASQLLHLADLAHIDIFLGLRFVPFKYLFVRDVKRSLSVITIHVLAAREDAQLLCATVGVRRPGRHPRLNGSPIGHHQPLAFRGHQRRAQHPLQHVRDPASELRHDLVTAHHCLPC